MVKSNGGIAMKTFPSYDYDLCNNEQCHKKESCMRYLTHKKAMSEKYPYPLWMVIPDEKCNMYVESK